MKKAFLLLTVRGEGRSVEVQDQLTGGLAFLLVHYIRNDALAQRFESVYSFRAQPMSPLISVVTEGEIESLALQLGWGTAKQQRLQQLLGRLTIVLLAHPRVALQEMPQPADIQHRGHSLAGFTGG